MVRFFEHILARLLGKRFNFAFRTIRFGYQAPFVLLNKFRKNIYVRVARAGDSEGEHLFGFYDKSPWDSSGQRLISMRVPFANQHPSIRDEGLVELVELEKGTTRSVGRTRAWNIQCGCRLQWLGPDFDSYIIYNDFRDARFVSVIRAINGGDERVIERPVWDVTRDGRTALSLDFERIGTFRAGYGYDRGAGVNEYERFPNNDGIWRVNLLTGVSELIISLKQIEHEIGDINEGITSTYFTHIMVNPSGTRFMFFLRWRKAGTECTSLYTASMDGSDIVCLAKDGMASHATWKNDQEIFVWARIKDFGDHFYLFRDRSSSFTIFGRENLTEDGHPSYSPCGRYILLDTYANSARRRKLYIFDNEKKSVVVLGRFYTPFRYSGEMRCDLHPRWKRDGSRVCFDAAFEGRRQVYIAEIPNDM